MAKETGYIIVEPIENETKVKIYMPEEEIDMPMITINGYETPVHIDRAELDGFSSVSLEGDTDHYQISYGNGLVEYGGTVTFTTSVAKDSYREAATQIELPFTIIDAHATALNITDSVNAVNGENAFIRINGNVLSIYGSFTGTAHKEMKVKWSAKGVIQNG